MTLAPAPWVDGLTIGQVVYGPLSDSVGRKPTIYAGLGLFVLGSALSPDFASAGVPSAGLPALFAWSLRA